MTAVLHTVRLAEVADLNPELGEMLRDDDQVAFIPMSAVDAETASTDDSTSRRYSQVSKGYRPFLDGDILVAKITPCFENGKIVQARLGRRIGFGSTEFHVVRAQPDRIDARYLLHFLRQDRVRREGGRKMTGSAGQRRVPEYFLAELPIPLPPLPEQRRIAEVLDLAAALRAKRRAALAQIDKLTQSIFLDMFGDPGTNLRQWKVSPMQQLFAIPPVFGTMIPPRADGGSWLSLRVANIQGWRLDLSDKKFVDLPASMLERHTVRDGDLLMARAIASQDHLGKAIVVTPGAQMWAFDSHLMRLRFDTLKTEPEFVRHFLMTPGGRARFLRAARRSAVQFNINTREISKLEIPVPPLALQRDFGRRIDAASSLRWAHETSLFTLDALFASLQHRAFRGEL